MAVLDILRSARQSLEDVGGAEGAAAARTLLNERGVLLAREAAARGRAIGLLRGLLLQEVRCKPASAWASTH